MAILAVAFVVLAAVPAALTDSDAADEPSYTTVDVKADITESETGCWKLQGTALTLEGNVELNVTDSTEIKDIASIDLDKYSLKITVADGKTLTLTAVTGITGTGKLVLNGDVKLTALTSVAGPVQIVKGAITFVATATLSGKLDVSGGTISNGTTTTTVNGDAVISGGTLTGDFKFSKVEMSKGTIDASKATTGVALNGSDVTYTGGTLESNSKELIDATKSVNATFSKLDDATAVLLIPTGTSNGVDVKLKCGSAEFGATLTGASSGVTYTSSSAGFTATGTATISGAITGTVKAEGTITLGTGLVAVKGILDLSAQTAAKDYSNIAVVTGGKLVINSTYEKITDSAKQVKDYGGEVYKGKVEASGKITDVSGNVAFGAIDTTGATAEQNLKTALFAAANAKADIEANAEKQVAEAKYHTVTLGAAVTMTGDLTIPSGVTLNLAALEITVGATNKIVNEGILTMTTGKIIKADKNQNVIFQNNGGTVEKATIVDASAASAASVELDDVSGIFGVAYIVSSDNIRGVTVSGSRIIGNDGTLLTTTDGSDPIAKVDTTLGSLTFGKISVEKNIYISGKETTGEDVVLDNVTVNNGASLKLEDGADGITVKGTMSVYGDVSAMKDDTQEGVTLNIPSGATFRMYNGSTMKNISLEGDGTIDVSQAQRVSEQGQDIGESKPFGTLEYVEIVGSLRVWNNADIVVYGGFAVDEGVTFTIEKGSTVTIASTTAEMKIAGKVVVEEGASFIVEDAKSIEITGSVKSQGELSFGEEGSKIITTIKSGGSVTSEKADKSEIEIDQLVIENGGLLTVESKMTISDVTNKGSIVLDGAEMADDSTITMAAGDASVEIKGVTGEYDLVITDDTLAFTKDKSVDSDSANTVTITPNAKTTVKGLTVTEKVTSSSGSYTNKFELSGSVSQTIEDGTLAEQVVSVNAKKGATIPGEMELGKKIKLTLEGNVSVSGTLKTTVSAGSDASKVTVESGAVVDVSGLIQSENQINPTGTLNAAEYQYKEGTSEVWRYSTLAKALEDKAENINILGTVKVTTDLTIPSGTTVRGNNLIVGSTSNRDITLTVQDGGALKNANTTVDATVYFENKKNNGTSIVSDVSIIGDVDARYTNIYTALNKAQAGDVVTITRETPVELSSDITIKEGVTLDVPISKELKVVKPITVTVNGTLKSDSDVTYDATAVSGGFAVKADTTKKTAAITLGANGIVMINSPSDVKTYASQYDRYQTAGAYFHMVNSVGDYYYITSVPYAASVITETETLTVDKASYNAVLFGTLVVGDVSFSGDSTKSVSVLFAGNYNSGKKELTASSITLSKATFVSDGTFTGTVSVGSNSVVLNKVSYAKATTAVTGVAYTLDVTVGSAENASATVSAGSVAVASADKITVKSGATMNAAKAGSDITEAVVDGTVDVAAGRTMKVDTLSVNGSAIAQPASGSDGKATLEVKQLYVGVSKSEITGAAASVTGEVNVTEFAVVKEGSTIAKETSDNFGKKYTEYYVDSTKWITVYDATAAKKISDITKAPVTNAYFSGKWLDADGASVGDAIVGDDGYGKVYADIEYEIYYVEIKADQGIGDLYLNGNIMAKGFKINQGTTTSDYYYAYWATVKAGDYEVTCKLANGYSGTAVLKNTDGSTVSNNKFTASGNPAKGESTVELDFQLTGIAKSGYVQPSEDKDDDSGMGITDYLLIVLVILVVVLAVIVALRLMRS